ncbi:MAG: amino acid permease [Methanocellales archaeon]|nr:amino acid permease [Methanocellales archaeon]
MVKQYDKLPPILGFLDASMIGIGAMVGAGIFVLPGLAANMAGPAIIISFLIAGIASMLTALCHAELATAIPKAGGAYVLVNETVGGIWGFLAGWGKWFSLVVKSGFSLLGLIVFASVFFQHIPRTLGIVTIGIAITFVNYVGVRISSKLQNIITLILLVTLGIFSAICIPSINPALYWPFAPYGWSNVFKAAGLLYVTFIGFAIIATMVEELKEPERNAPRAMVLSIGVVTCVYMLVALAMTGIVAYDELHPTKAIVDVAEVVMGDAGIILITIIGFLAMISTINMCILAASRISLAMGRDRNLPFILSRVHPTFKTPHISVFLIGIVVIAGAIIADIEKLAKAANVLVLFAFMLVDFAVIYNRQVKKKMPAFKTPGYPVTPMLGAASCLILIAQFGAKDLIIGFGVLSTGIAWYIYNTAKV